MKDKRNLGAAVAILVLLFLVGAVAVFADAVQPELWVKRILMYPDSSIYPGLYMNSSGDADLLRLEKDGNAAFTVANSGEVTIGDALGIVGDTDEAQLTVTGYTTQTEPLLLLEQSGGQDLLTVNGHGRTDSLFERDGLTGYDYGFTLSGYATGVAGGAKTRAMSIDLVRPAGYEIQAGDMEDVGLIIRVDTHAVTTTAGTVLRGVDAEAKADNPGGTVTNLYGGSFTAKSDTSAGSVGSMVALQANAQNNAAVDDLLVGGDIRLMRQAATEPTEEYILHVRSSSTSGTGADAAIYIESDGSVGYEEADDLNYGIDMSAAEIDNADIRLQNGATIRETTDTVIAFGEFVGFAEGAAETIGAGEQIDPVATYHPITAAGSVSTSADGIAVGTFTGQLLILVMEGAGDITVDGTGGNVECKANVTLDTGDTLTLIWDGADWRCLSNYDNS
ncbi:MAG: hypothetical protein ABIH46_01605 [Chloroflexota bacterium]